MFDKVKQLGELKKMRDQAVKIQKELKKEKIEIEEAGVKVVVSGNQEIQLLEVDGEEEERIKRTVNQALKKSQKVAAKRLQQMSGGLKGLLGG